MTPAQKIMVRQNEIEARLSELALVGKRSAEQDAEILALNEEKRGLPAKLEAAFKAEASDDALRADGASNADPFAETAGLAAQTSVGEFLHNLFQKREHDGALAELQSHLGLGRNDLPLDLLRGGDIQAAATPAPSDVGRNEQPVIQPVFVTGAAAFLRFDMPMVDFGEALFPVLETRPTVSGPFTDSTAAAETDGMFAVNTLAPSRLTALFRYRATDAVKFRGQAPALRQALMSGLSEALDEKAVGQVVADVTRTAASAADDFGSYRSRLIYGRIDSRFARRESDIRVLLGDDTLAHMAGQYRSNTADDSALDSVRRVSGGVDTSPHVPAVVGNKQDALCRLGARRDAVQPVWRAASIIFDEVTAAAKGEIVITASLQYAVKILRAAAFARIQTQHA